MQMFKNKFGSSDTLILIEKNEFDEKNINTKPCLPAPPRTKPGMGLNLLITSGNPHKICIFP
jgi:hypothetical protein